jgi:hypothetical protein
MAATDPLGARLRQRDGSRSGGGEQLPDKAFLKIETTREGPGIQAATPLRQESWWPRLATTTTTTTALVSTLGVDKPQ